MRRERDPVDSALELLRSESWTAEPWNPDLENQLMNSIDPKPRAGVNGRHVGLAAVALVAVSGAAFAATGGIARIQKWLNIEINGVSQSVPLDENGRSQFTVQTEDGGEALVEVERTGTPEEGQQTRIRVTKGAGEDGGMQVNEEVEAVQVRRTGHDGMELTGEVSAAELAADATLLKEWTDKAGAAWSLYSQADGDVELRYYLVRAGETGEAKVITLPLAPPAMGDVQPQVTVGDDGMIEVRFDDGAGRVAVMKIAHRSSDQAGPLPEIVAPGISTPDGRLRIRVSESEEGDGGK